MAGDVSDALLKPELRPRVLLVGAITLDGKLAENNLRPAYSLWRKLKPAVDAVLVADPVPLRPAPRSPRGSRQTVPLGVYLPTAGPLAPALAGLAQMCGKLLLYSTESQNLPADHEHRAKISCRVVPALDLNKILFQLSSEHGVRALLCPGGGWLARTLAEIGAIDEIHLNILSSMIGGTARPGILGVLETYLPTSLTYHLRSLRSRRGQCYLHYVV